MATELLQIPYLIRKPGDLEEVWRIFFSAFLWVLVACTCLIEVVLQKISCSAQDIDRHARVKQQ